jgi:hypothetical protein
MNLSKCEGGITAVHCQHIPDSIGLILSELAFMSVWAIPYFLIFSRILIWLGSVYENRYLNNSNPNE